MSEEIKKALESAKYLIQYMMNDSSLLYCHMKAAMNGQTVKWMNDSVLNQDFQDHGAFELALYRMLRSHREELLSPANKIRVAHGAVRVRWTSGGHSDSVIYQTQSGVKMLCCANWTSGPVELESMIPSISSIESIM